MVEPTDELQVVFEKAIKDAKKLHPRVYYTWTFIFAMLCSDNFMKVLNGFGIDPEPMKQELLTHPQTKLDEIKVAEGTKFKSKKHRLWNV